MLELARKALATGLKIGGKTYAVEILDQDTQSDPPRAGQLAKDLINSDKIDMMLVISTPETINPGRRRLRGGGRAVPLDRHAVGGVVFRPRRQARPAVALQVDLPLRLRRRRVLQDLHLAVERSIQTNKKVGVLYPNDADGNAIRENLAPALAKAGFTIVDPGAYEDGTTDYSAQIALFKKEKCEIFNTFPIPPDFAAFWRQAAQQGYTKMVKIAQIAKTGLFPAEIEALGYLGINLASAAYWHKTFPYKSPLTGVSGQELADGYETATGKQWTQQLGATMSLLDAGFEALKASSDPADKAALAKALSTLKTTDHDRQGRLHPGPVPNVSPAPIIGTQWVKAPAGTKFKLDLRGRPRTPPTPTCRSRPSSCRTTAEATDGRRDPSARQRRRRIGKRFDALRVLDDVDFAIAADEAVGIVGPNGAGKTTLLSVLVGAFPPNARLGHFQGQDVTARSRPRTAAGSGSSARIRSRGPFGGMTVFENVFVAAAHGAGLGAAKPMTRRSPRSNSAAC